MGDSDQSRHPGGWPSAKPPKRQAEFHFIGELNDFLPPGRRGRRFVFAFAERTAVKDVVEAIGPPHPEIAGMAVDGESAYFDRLLFGGERVEVFPAQSAGACCAPSLRPEPPRPVRFILDAHLGRLARHLRMLGFDTRYRNDFEDGAIAAIAARERRVILTRDIGLLKRRNVIHGRWLRAVKPRRQLEETLDAFGLRDDMAPFTRCMDCNGLLVEAPKDTVFDRLPPRIRLCFDAFVQCADCDKVYWPGGHYERMRRLIDQLRRPCRSGQPKTHEEFEADVLLGLGAAQRRPDKR